MKRHKARHIPELMLSSGAFSRYSKGMRCDVCGSSDSVFFIKPDGYGGELRMCRSCAVARGYASAGDGLGARLDSMMSDGDAPMTGTCPACGWTAALLRSSGRLGCAGCVAVFRREILAAIQRAGGRLPYDGKMPRGGGARELDGASLASLSSSLDLAIAEEDFEAAAVIRDRIRAVSGRREP